MKRIVNRLLAVALTVCFMILIFALVLTAGLASPTQAGPTPSAAPAPLAVNVGNQVFAEIGITQTTTGAARYLVSYSADCYLTTVLTGTQNATFSLQHSPDANTWVDLAQFDPVSHSGASSATTIEFSPTLAFYGTYIRGIATLTGTTPANIKLVCTYH